MKALLEQFPLGIALAASMVGLLWVAIIAIGQRLDRAKRSQPYVRRMGDDIGHGVAYDSSGASYECGPSTDIGGDCGGGSGGGD